MSSCFASRALERCALSEEVRSLRERLGAAAPLREQMGPSSAIADVIRQVEEVAASTLTVLLQGEMSTGREVVARAIHAHSPRREGPFVAVDCGAIPETSWSLSCSQREGPFTDADGRSIPAGRGRDLVPGRHREPAGVDPSKLLRVLQDRQIQPLGSAGLQRVDVWVLCGCRRWTCYKTLHLKIKRCGLSSRGAAEE